MTLSGFRTRQGEGNKMAATMLEYHQVDENHTAPLKKRKRKKTICFSK
jgi:hypothetical protein